MKHSSEQKTSGFTLIEMLIVVAIIGVLLAIAVPAYNEYILRAHRAAAQQFLLDVAQREEQYLLDNRQYTKTLGAGGLGLTMPADVGSDYAAPNFDGVKNDATPPSFMVFMTPNVGGRMANDGNLVANNTAQKWRDIDGDNTYTAGKDKPW